MFSEIEKTLSEPIERIKLEDFDYKAAPPSRDEFKRAPMPQSKPKSEAATSKSLTGAQLTVPGREKAAKSATPFYKQLQAKGKNGSAGDVVAG